MRFFGIILPISFLSILMFSVFHDRETTATDIKDIAQTETTKQTSQKSAEAVYQKAENFYRQKQPDSAYAYFNAVEAFANTPDKNLILVKSKIRLSEIEKDRGDINKAYETISEAYSLADKFSITDVITLADLFHVYGTIVTNYGEYQGSIDLLLQSIDYRIKAGGADDTLLSPSYNNLGVNYFYTGDYKRALHYFKLALKNSLKKKDVNDPKIAVYYQSIGMVYIIIGEFDEADLYFKKSLNINKKILPLDAPQLAKSYNNLGLFYKQISQYDEALKTYKLSEKIALKNPSENSLLLGSIYSNIGGIYLIKTEYDKALQYFENALKIFEVKHPPNHPDITSALMSIGQVYYQKQNFIKALDYFQRSLSQSQNAISQAKNLRNIANCYAESGNIENAEKYYNLTRQAALNLSDDSLELAHTYLYYGDFLLNTNRKDKALENYNSALSIYKSFYGTKHLDIANCYSRIGRLYDINKDFYNALMYYQLALTAIVADYDEKDIYSNPDINNTLHDFNLLSILNNKATAFYHYYQKTGNTQDLKSSLSTNEITILLIEKIRSAYYSEENKLQLTETFRKVFSNSILAALTLYEKTSDPALYEKAFEFAEKGKSSILLSTIRGIEARQFGKIPETLQNIEKDLITQITNYNNFVYNERIKSSPDLEKIKLWQEKLLNLNKKYDQLINKLESEYPDYYKLKYNKSLTSLSDIQNKLPAGKAMLEYTMTDSLIIAFIITPEQFDYKLIRIDSSLYEQVDTFHTLLTQIDYSQNSVNNFCGYAYNLYSLLIKPFEKEIKDKSLLIIPDSWLGYIPFDALTTKKAVSNSFKQLPYLINEHKLSYAYSATLYFNSPKTPKHGKKLAAFIPSYENILTNKNASNEFPSEICKTLVPLTAANAEIDAISKITKCKVLKGENATEKIFKASAGKYDILHLAMHTVLNDRNPMYSKLIFTLNNDTVEDGFLNTYELYNLDLKAKLVVLSACNTGFGILSRGEGIMSLARGFLHADCPSIVMSLWSLEDVSSASIMESFYRHLKLGEDKDQAIRNAKLEHLQNSDALKAHPYFWAGFVTIGDVSPVYSASSNVYYFIAFSILALISVLILIFRKRIRKLIKSSL